MSERKCERCESRLYPSDKRVCVACVELDAERAAFQRGSEHGQRFERAAIVAWLRSEACFTWLRRNTDGFTVGQADDLSVAISDGEHLRGDDE